VCSLMFIYLMDKETQGKVDDDYSLSIRNNTIIHLFHCNFTQTKKNATLNRK
jgi:hypothetical protein